MNPGLWQQFRDEIIATSLVLGLSVVGSFLLVHRLADENKSSETKKTVSEAEEQSQVLGEAINQAIEEATTTTGDEASEPTRNPSPTVTPSPEDTEVFYGLGGTHSFADYELVIKIPRITFNIRASESRTFLVDMILRNKSIEAGLTNRITAAIVKDGMVIVPQAAMSVTESKIVRPGEQLTFQARLSLIEGTDVKSIQFEPKESTNHVKHDLQSGPQP
jgi:hypothetical protein